MTKSVDTLIIGSGVAGTTVARRILNGGAQQVLMLEAGHEVPMADSRLWNDFIMKGLKDENRPYANCVDDPDPKTGSYTNNHFGLNEDQKKSSAYNWYFSGSRLIVRGGTLLHWGGWSFRLKPEDFLLYTNTKKGIDWAITYDELEPFYSRAERLLQVMGTNDDPNQPPMPTGGYPYKSIPYPATDKPLIDLWESEGIIYGPVPLSRNTIRDETQIVGLSTDPEPMPDPILCQATGTCKYCPIKGKFTNDQSLEYVVDYHEDNFELVTNAPVKRILFNGDEVTGVIYVDRTRSKEVEIKARQIIICAGAIETPKLLTISGLENPHIGRHLTSHPLFISRGYKFQPNSTLQQEIHFPTLCSRHFDTEREQKEGKLLFAKYYTNPYAKLEAMMSEGRSTSEIKTELQHQRYEVRGFIENVEGANTVVRPSQETDKWGLPKTEFDIRGMLYPRKTINKHLELMENMLLKMGYSEKLSRRIYRPRGDHAMSTTRMAADSKHGVVDQNLKVHGYRNLHIVSNSVFPTGGVINPTLTLTALSIKFGDHFVDNYLQ